MKIATILGSPRKKGNTATVLGLFEEIMAKKHDIDRINLMSSEVRGCLGCGDCQKEMNEPGCVQKDDAVSLFMQMMAADAVIYASPLYCWGFSSQMKALIDRHYCLVTGYGTSEYTSLINHKRVSLLVTCAGPEENNADLIQELFVRLSNFCNCNIIGKYVVPLCSSPDSLGPKGMEVAEKMAKDIIT
ncbi:MAG: flavodoxin family protein [Thermodesulfobacteriota bacterium]|nr:flavodoxin family protein [Thermodesulfobacteriota bacterium]